MNRPWNGVWYNAAAVIVGWSVPKSLLIIPEIDSIRFVDADANQVTI